ERKQRSRYQPDARKAAFGEPKKNYRDNRGGVENGVGNHGRILIGGTHSKAQEPRSYYGARRIVPAFAMPSLQSSAVNGECLKEKEKRSQGERHGCADEEPLSRSVCPLEKRSRRLLGRSGTGDRLVRAAQEDFRQECRSLWPLVHRRRVQYLLQRHRPS